MLRKMKTRTQILVRNVLTYSHQPKVETTQNVHEDKWVIKLLYVHTMEYFTFVKRKEIPTHAAIWIELNNILLSEIGQTRKDKYMIPLM